MKGSRNRRRAIRAAELLGGPEHKEKLRQHDILKGHHAAEYRKAAGPLLEELIALGYAVNTVGELRSAGREYRDAVPVLVRWLPRVGNRYVKEDIVRTLSVPWARDEAAGPLLEEFRRTADQALRWIIANALEVLADDAALEDIVALVKDKANGKAREMLVVALGNMRAKAARELLMALLEDEQLVGHAIKGVAKLRMKEAVPRLQELAQHPIAWIRNEAKAALQLMERMPPRSAPGTVQ
jgi:hypothetical protein